MTVHLCRVCDEPIVGPWLMLNRYGCGNGKTHCLSEVTDDDGDYVWEQDFTESNKSDFTGVMLHWPTCAAQWIEGKMIETQVEISIRERGET